MVLRWVAAGMAEAATQFRRVNGYLHLPTLRAARRHHHRCHTGQGGCRLITRWAATEVPRRAGHPLAQH